MIDGRRAAVVVFYGELSIYPPLQSVLRGLIKSGFEVTYIGGCDGVFTRDALARAGVTFASLNLSPKGSPISKLFRLFKLRRLLHESLKQPSDNQPERIIIAGVEALWVLPVPARVRSLLQVYLFEFPPLRVPWRFRMFTRSGHYAHLLRRANEIFMSDGNRAAFLAAYFGLHCLPKVIPNNIERELARELVFERNPYPKALHNKKIILYQGILNQPERRIAELIQALNHLDPSFVVAVASPDSKEKRSLARKFSGDRCYFLDYLPYPRNLAYTKFAYIGFISYHPIPRDISHCINTMFCAPNKLYEYTRFSLPIIANDVLNMRSLILEHRLGVKLDFFTPECIASAVKKISDNYTEYSSSASEFFLSQANMRDYDLITRQ